mmetsp:Transcript_23553/g.34928  ORF Transcript_23553/g.34928 Transcript_23553/m.34928 type:complete len:187 (+) Transcript_23553:181-741(+)
MTDSQQMVLANETDENNHHDGAITVYTPSSTDLVIHDPERFHFLSPKSNIRKFESEVLKRQAEYSSRISDLEGRLALFHARLAIESAERGREHASTMEDFVNVPLEEAMIRSLQKIETDFVRPIMNHKRADDIQQWQQQQQQQHSNNKSTSISSCHTTQQQSPNNPRTNPSASVSKRQTLVLPFHL